MVHENPRFAITPNHRRRWTRDDATASRGVAGVAVGQNLLSLDLEAVRRNLEVLPLVRHVEVRRLLPQKLFIHVDERIAVARLRSSTDSELLIDRSGFVMKPLRSTDGTIVRPQTVGPVPTLSGVPLADVHVGKPVQSEADLPGARTSRPSAAGVGWLDDGGRGTGFVEAAASDNDESTAHCC